MNMKDPPKYGSDPDLAGNSRLTTTRKRKGLDMDHCNCESSMIKFRQELLEVISGTIKSTVESALSDKFDKFSSDLDSIKTEMKKITNDNINISVSLSKINGRLNEFEASNSLINNRQDEFDSRLSTIEQSAPTNEQYAIDIAELQKKYDSISTQLKIRDQWDRLLNLEIIGVPETNNEDLVKVITKIAKFVDVIIIPNDIEFSTRIQPMQPKPGVPRAIITKFKIRETKDKILAGFRRFRGITRNDIGMQGTEPIFLNEHLTLDNKNLYKKCRELAISKSYKYVWIRNCRIFVRRDDKSPRIVINKENDLLKIK